MPKLVIVTETPYFLAELASAPRLAWAPVAIMILVGLGFAVTTVVLSLIIGPSRTGPGKSTPYESGMNPVGDTRRRFNVRFYIVAMIYLVFDVGIVFLFPWASLLAWYSLNTDHGSLLLIQIIVFIAILMVAYTYAWRKGVFRWD
ncbi:MAG: NADH-quinone oxidoreductase subunit A [Phycisphaerae bacterium]|nr:MAG: NADH-quinone oxidoreductase subunit A [Phycisphaerae bacterium]